MDNENEEREYRWQESILSLVKGLFRNGGRSMDGFDDNEIKTNCHFNLWTRTNPIVSQALFIDDTATLSRSTFNLTNPTKVFVHGWGMNGHSQDLLLSLRNGMAKMICNRRIRRYSIFLS